MINAINLKDQFCISKDRIVLTEEQTHIPGLSMIGHHTINSALSELTWHYHKDSFEFSVSTNGTFFFVTQDKSYQFSAGEVFVSFPNEIHGTDQMPFPLGDIYWFQLDISDPDRFLFLHRDAACELIDRLMNIPHHVIHVGNIKILQLIVKAFDAVYRENSIQLAASYLLLFLNLIISPVEKDFLNISPNIQKALSYIDDNISSDLQLEQLADVAILSCSQFKKNFKNAVGISPRNYINQKKIELGKKLLLQGKSVTETAMYLNFSSSNYFSTVFKKYTRYTPKEFVQSEKRIKDMLK